MAVIEAVVGAGTGVASMGVSVALQVLAGTGQSMTAGAGKRHSRGARSGSGVTGALNGAFAKLEMPRLHIGLFLTGGVGLAGTGLGNLLNRLTTWANHLVDQWLTAWVGGGVGFLVSGAALVMLVKDLKEDRGGPRTLALAGAVPSLVAAIPGPVGEGAADAIAWVAQTLGHMVASAFGLQ